MNNVEILTTENNSSLEYADHVICIMCDTEMLVDLGTETCPKCSNKGCLSWADNDKPEVAVRDFVKVQEYIIKN